MQRDVFISHSSHDKPVAEAVCAALEARGLSCWIAPRDIPPGSEYAAAIVEGIESARLFVVIVSSRANASSQVLREVERAVSKGLRLMPLRIEIVPLGKSMEYFLSSQHWLDATTQPFDQHLERIQASVARALEKSVPEAVLSLPVTTREQGIEGSLSSSTHHAQRAPLQPSQIVLSVSVEGRTPVEQTYDTSRDRRLFIGGSPMCEIRLADRGCSQRHAMILFEGSGWYIQDLGSKNGTYLNGCHVQSQVLRIGDIIHIGHSVLRVVGIGPPLTERA